MNSLFERVKESIDRAVIDRKKAENYTIIESSIGYGSYFIATVKEDSVLFDLSGEGRDRVPLELDKETTIHLLKEIINTIQDEKDI